MPPHRPVPSLLTICHDRVLYQVCAIILEELFFGEQRQWEQLGHPVLSPRLQAVRDILSNALLPKLLQDLLNTILERDEAVEPTVRFTAVQLLLVPGVTKLAVGHFPEPFYAPVLSTIAESAAELKFLDLRGIWVRAMHKYFLCKVIRRIHAVEHLVLRYTCDDEVLAIIGKHCTELVHLDICGSENITSEGMRSLYERRIQDVFKGFNDISQTLKIVDIGGPGAQHLPVSQVGLLLRFLPNLISLGSYERTGVAVELLCADDPTLSFNLIFLHDLYTSLQRLEIISKSCPKLHEVHLDCPKASAVQHLHLLKSLRQLRINKARWSDLQLSLPHLKHNLNLLFLSTVWGPIDLFALANHCEFVTRLELHGITLANSSQERDRLQLPELVELLVYRTSLSGSNVKQLLLSSAKLKHVAFGECNQVTDEQMLECLQSAQLSELEELWFGQASRLSMATLQHIMERCSAITSIGNLAGWNMGPGETAFIRMQLALTNTALTLHDYGPDSDDDQGAVLLLFNDDNNP